MHKNYIATFEAIEKVALALEEINEEVVFVGGAVVAFYVTDDGASQPRPTKDIDISVQVSSYLQMEQFREKLASKNIHPASTETVIYRYLFDGIFIDFIPCDKTHLGPTNRWLKLGFHKAFRIKVATVEIKILPVELFLATKWEAYKNRGGDPRLSHDFEDIIYIIDNNSDIIANISDTENSVKVFLQEMSREILSHFSRNEIIECHLEPSTAEGRRKLIVEKLEQILIV